jgi:hypothetical protein
MTFENLSSSLSFPRHWFTAQAVLIGRYLRAIRGIERAEAQQGLVSIGLIFVWQFSNFVCVLLAAVGLGYPSLPSKLGNLVRWGSLSRFPAMLTATS